MSTAFSHSVTRFVMIVASVAAVSGARAADVTSTQLPATPLVGSTVSGDAHVLVAPLLGLLRLLGVPVEPPAPLPNSAALERADSWQTFAFDVHDDGIGICLEVAGRVEFDRAGIAFGDGTRVAVPLRDAVRGSGLYVLVDLPGMTRVATVTLHARARSATARVGVRLARFAGDEDDSR